MSHASPRDGAARIRGPLDATGPSLLSDSARGAGAGARILLYSHDSYGLGHLRRTLTLAGALAQTRRDASVLIVSGSPCATQFALPRGVEIVKLPAVTKDDDGAYTARNLRGGLELLGRLRRNLLLETFETFAPDVLIADHQPIGLAGELLPVLRRARQTKTQCVLGLRDIIDDPAVVAEQWSHPDIREALAHLYERVCVYGDVRLFDQRLEYPIPPELSQRVEYTGYVVRAGAVRTPSTGTIARRQVLMTAGGGEDGQTRIECFLELLKRQPPAWDSTIVLGPLLHPAQARRLKREARALRNVRVHSFHADLPRLLAETDVVVSMAGYNSVAEILQARVNSVLLPRAFPRREQLIRAQRLEAAGLATCQLELEPRELRRAIDAALDTSRDWRGAPAMNGQERMCEIVGGLLEGAHAERNGGSAVRSV